MRDEPQTLGKGVNEARQRNDKVHGELLSAHGTVAKT